jgi:hypothetical protein
MERTALDRLRVILRIIGCHESSTGHFSRYRPFCPVDSPDDDTGLVPLRLGRSTY